MKAKDVYAGIGDLTLKIRSTKDEHLKQTMLETRSRLIHELSRQAALGIKEAVKYLSMVKK